MGPLVVGILAFWIALPTYIPNNAAVLTGGGQPIDGGRRWGGARILGDGKTWRGTIGGIGAGIVLALLLNAMNGTLSELLGIGLPTFTWEIIVAFPVGALLGDILASFLKRRTGRRRGAAFPLVDQFDFLLVALLLGLLVDPGWMREVFSLGVVVALVVLTPVLHVATNGVAYVLGLKQEPW